MAGNASRAVDVFIKLGYAVLWGAALRYLIPFFSVALYSSPSTDDFCIASYSVSSSLSAVWQYYISVTGRLPALVLIAIPSWLARAMKVDLYALYPLVNVFAIAAFLAAMIVTASMLLRTDDCKSSALFGLLFGAFALSLVPNISEFIYWVTGEACYLTATAGASLMAAWTAKQTLNREHIDGRSLAAILTLCFITPMFNEFTVFFLIGLAVLSLMARLLFMRGNAQVMAHLAILAAILAGYCVILFSPSNVIRLGSYPLSGNIGASLENASIYTVDYTRFLVHLPVVQSFGILTACFGVATARALRFGSVTQYLLFAVAMLCLGALWAYTSYFVGAYGTGEVLALRARNEVVVVVFIVAAISIVAVVQAVVGVVLQLVKLPIVAGVVSFFIVAFGTWFITDIRSAPGYQLLQTEWPQLGIYWQESLARNAFILTSPSSNVVVPRRTVSPSLLAGDELKETAFRLPNDCIAKYYGKASVVLAHTGE